MPKSVNKVHLLGNVGNAPEYKVLRDGTTLANFSLATSERRLVNVAEWHSIVAFGKLAEIVRQYVLRGSRVFIEGRLQTRSWDDKESGKRLYRTEIIMQELTLLGGPDSGRYEADEYSQVEAGDAYEGA